MAVSDFIVKGNIVVNGVAIESDGTQLVLPGNTVVGNQLITQAIAGGFSVAADDSTQRFVNLGESIKFSGTGGITTASNEEGDITISGPILATVATSGSYNDLLNLPSLFDGQFSSLTNTPTTLSGYGITDAFSGDYEDLANKPAIPQNLLDLNINDGSLGQVLTTDGAGNFSFATVSQEGGGGDPDQNLWATITADSGSTTANTTTDTLTVAGGTNIATSISGDTLTISFTGSAGGASNFDELADVSNAGIDVNDIFEAATVTLRVNNEGASAYTFNSHYSGNNPTIYAVSGTTIAFDLSQIGGHPFEIRDPGGSALNSGLVHVSTTGTVSTGSNAQGFDSGTLYWRIQESLSGNYSYICQFHSSMSGTITINSSDFSDNFNNKTTTDLSEGTNLYFTNARIDNHLSGGTGVTYSSGEISIGQAVATNSNVQFNDLVITGNLTVQGTETVLETATLQVEDQNIELGKVATPSNATANTGGITVLGGTDGNKTWKWLSATDSWTSSEHIDAADGKEYKINGNKVLDSSSLGSSVVSSSLTSVGTLNSGSISSGFGNINIGSSTFTGNGSGLSNVDAATLEGENGVYYLNYNNFSNTPTIGDGTLTLATSGIATGSQTFTANQTGSATFTVDVPGTNLSVTGGTTTGPAINSSTGDNVTLPTADASASGVVTTGNQTFAGTKTFNNTITGSVSGNAGTATALETARTINGTSFNGTANITVPGNFADRTTDESGHAVFIGTTATGNQEMFTNSNYRFNPSTGELSATDFNSTSDVNLKDNVTDIKNALDLVNEMRGVRYTWKDNGIAGVGVIAQEIEQVLPEVVSESGDHKTVSYGNVVGVLIEAIKELKTEIEELKTHK